METGSGFEFKLQICVWNLAFPGKSLKTRVQEGAFVFPGKSPSPPKFNANTYKPLFGAIFEN
jgi:hypothetical protein